MRRWRLVAPVLLVLVAAGLVARPSQTSAVPSPDMVISQVYGGGGNAGATYTHDAHRITLPSLPTYRS